MPHSIARRRADLATHTLICRFGVAAALAASAGCASPPPDPNVVKLGPLTLGEPRSQALSAMGVGASGIDAISGFPADVYADGDKTLALVFHSGVLNRISFYAHRPGRDLMPEPEVLVSASRRVPLRAAPAAKVPLSSLSWMGQAPSARLALPSPAPSGWKTQALGGNVVAMSSEAVPGTVTLVGTADETRLIVELPVDVR